MSEENKATAPRPHWTHVKTPFGRTGIREKGVEVAVASSPQIAALIVRAVNGLGEVEAMRKALEWYGEQARLCRLIHSDGDPGRHALQADGGKRANAALSRGEG